MDTVSYLTINGETREIVDAESRNDITVLQAQIEYMAEELNVDLSKVSVKQN